MNSLYKKIMSILCQCKGIFFITLRGAKNYMIKREEIFDYIREKFNTVPDYPWAKSPEAVVLRHKDSGKWYGLIMNIPKIKIGLTDEGNVDVLNIKCDPVLNSLLRSEEGIYSAYHMNKKHWITIALDSSFPKEEVYKLIDISYDLTK